MRVREGEGEREGSGQGMANFPTSSPSLPPPSVLAPVATLGCLPCWVYIKVHVMQLTAFGPFFLVHCLHLPLLFLIFYSSHSLSLRLLFSVFTTSDAHCLRFTQQINRAKLPALYLPFPTLVFSCFVVFRRR